ncbi:non-ribosomal peptide synthetase [Streptomyces sp. NBRC 110611]|uniref:non-ribosomal peptide synthetase n=1 Tax=Streptomyces sp. NBRC 110611 TaxID=1621259 RepID=UPI00215BF84E|nr:non-ribosomal peptide synthetase [Streptomyces sp. NBRC 110611]
MSTDHRLPSEPAASGGLAAPADPGVRPGPSAGLPALVAWHAQRSPHALAVADGDRTLTYAQLDAAARALARYLRRHGVRQGDAVALLMARSARTVVAQLALWRAGAVCVPLDPAHPRPRSEALAADAGVSLTVGDGKLLESAAPAGATLALPDEPPADVFLADDEPLTAEAPAAEAPAAGPASAAEPDRDTAAFIMFTSGSTGRPKGVAVAHRAIAELVTDPAYVTLTARDRVLFHSPMTFDASTFEVWSALANGAAVVVCAVERPSLEDLAQQAERHGVTVAFFTTALFHQLAVRHSRLFALLRTVVVGGEALAAHHAREVLRAFPWLELVNGYGPTETTTFATAHRVTDADCDGQVPIGLPIAGASVYVVDDSGRPVPDGERGELWVGGSRLALGYIGRPELTAERFVSHPEWGRLYRTGDVVSRRPDGVLDFHGRTDDQVKVRGFRIEPGEVEHALREQPEVADAAVAVHRPSPDDARLVAFVVAAPGPVPRPAGLRDRLAAVLPAHLVPDELTVVGELPLTPSGKVDRRALTDLLTGDDGTAPAAPLTPLEQAVAELWSRSLGREVSRPDAEFLALGGHSLLALAVTDDLREELGVELTLADFFAAPTVADQAALVERALLAAHHDLHPHAPEDTDGHH